jgi:hypothetical protein
VVTPTFRWSVDIYYSGFTTVEVDAIDSDQALERGQEEAERRLGLGIILDPDGAMAQLIASLEPWEECDTAELVG